MTRLLTVAAAALMAAGCGMADPTGGLPPGDAQLAILNALPSGSVTTLLLDDEPIALPATGARSARVIPEGSHRLEVRTAGGSVVASAPFTVAQGGRRTAVIGGTVSTSIALLVAADTASVPVGDAAKVRFVHTVQGIPDLEAWFSPGTSTAGPPELRLVSPFVYGVGLSGEFPGYVVRPAGNYRLTITQQATGRVLTDLVRHFEAGEVWSVVLTRRTDGELELMAIQER